MTAKSICSLFSSSVSLSTLLISHFMWQQNVICVRVNGKTSLYTAKFKLLIVIYSGPAYSHIYTIDNVLVFFFHSSQQSICPIQLHASHIHTHTHVTSSLCDYANVLLIILLWFNKIKRSEKKEDDFFDFIGSWFFFHISYHHFR